MFQGIISESVSLKIAPLQLPWLKGINASLILRNLEDAISEGKLGGDAWGKEKKKDTALKGKRDQIVGNRKSWQLTATQLENVYKS